MSLFGSLMGDFEDDFFGSHMNAMNMHMRSMNRMMNSFMPDPFNMLASPFDAGFPHNALMDRQQGGGSAVGGHQNALMSTGGLFGFPAMPNINRMMSGDMGGATGGSYCSSSVITMSSGPDGRPQIYQATSSTKTGPGGIRETRRTVQDSMNGVKKMAIGHHIGDRAHIIEKEEDLRSGQLEERQEFINLDEDQATEFDNEFTSRANSGRRGGRGYGNMASICAAPSQMQAIQPSNNSQLTIEELNDDDDDEALASGSVGTVQQPAAAHYPSSHSNASRHHKQNHNSHHYHRRQMPAANLSPQEQLMDQQQTQLLNNSNWKETAGSGEGRGAAGANATATTTATASSRSTQRASKIKYKDHSSKGGEQGQPGVARTAALEAGEKAAKVLKQDQQQLQQHHNSFTPSLATSVQHPHPYNASAARRGHRSKQHSKKASGSNKNNGNHCK